MDLGSSSSIGLVYTDFVRSGRTDTGGGGEVCSSVVGVVVSEGLVLPVDEEGWLLLTPEYDELPPLCAPRTNISVGVLFCAIKRNLI